MALLLALIGLGLVLVDDDLLGKSLLLDFACDGSTFDVGRADFGLLIPTDEEDFVDGDFAARLGFEFLDIDFVADGDFDLLAASFDDCVPVLSSLVTLVDTRYRGSAYPPY